MFFSVLCLLCLCARRFICAFRSPAGKGLTSWLSFVVSNCDFVTFALVSWVSHPQNPEFGNNSEAFWFHKIKFGNALCI